jgi:hypothetical protein
MGGGRRAAFTAESLGQPLAVAASGSVNRSSCPESVRHVSVTIAAQRRLLTDW